MVQVITDRKLILDILNQLCEKFFNRNPCYVSGARVFQLKHINGDFLNIIFL